MLVTNKLIVAIDLHSMEKILSTFMATVNCLAKLFSAFLKIYYFVFDRKKDTQTGLEQVEAEKMVTEMSLLGELSL